MEYEKHIKRLVLGYLKDECKSAYKVFLRYNFHSYNKHIATRVAGQTLEDILRIYSRIQEIIQGHLEDTDYYRKNRPEFSSPLHLADQLVYILENLRGLTPASTPCPRSPGESSVVEDSQEHGYVPPHASDTETTPEHLLPGNVASSNEDDCHMQTPWQKSRIPVCKTPHVDKLPTPDKEVISEVMSQKLLENKEFQEKLAKTINKVLKSPDIVAVPDKADTDKNKDNLSIELGETVKDIMRRTEQDPMFDEMLDDLIGTPIGDTISKAITMSTVTPTSSYNTIPYSSSQSKRNLNFTEECDRNVPASESDARSEEFQEIFDSGVSNKSVPEQMPVIAPDPNVSSAITTSQTQCIVNTVPNNLYVMTQSTTGFPTLAQPQQVYLLNQPYVIPQQTSLIQVGQSCVVPSQPNIPVKTYKEQEIMSMPTLFLNERNEITYADPISLTATTPLKMNEARNIKEYLTLYGASDQSPILKIQQKKTKRSRPLKISPMRTVRVEYCAVDSIPSKTDPPNNISTKQVAPCTKLPSLNEHIEEANPTPINTEAKTNSQPRKDLPSSTCTPPTVATGPRKLTPRSSSHVRNLTFPSPLKKTPPETNVANSPSVVNKQQATKDLFKEKVTVEADSSQIEDKSKALSEKSKKSDKDSSKTPKKQNSKKGKEATPKSWDAHLRSMALPHNEETSSTPIRRKKTRRSSNHVSEPNSQLDDVLKTPASKTKSKRKSLTRSKDKSPSKSKSDNSNQQGETETCSKSDPKILSPSKLNANKRNILTTDYDNITPDNPRDVSHYPISSRNRKNINNMLNSPVKDGTIPPTPGGSPGRLDTPFTPMLKANLKDFAAGDNIFSIDTPNFPVTPGFSIVSNTNDYYIPKANETDKVTEAIVTLEEKKSSVRSTDTEIDDENEHIPKVYGSREILDNFNRTQVGKKNLELLDRNTISWEASSDREDKSEETSENDNEDQLNHTVIPAKSTNQYKHIKTLMPKKSQIPGKHMEFLKSQLLDEEQTFVDHSLDESIIEVVSLEEDCIKSCEKQSTSPEICADKEQRTEKRLSNVKTNLKEVQTPKDTSSNSEFVQRTEEIRNTIINVVIDKTTRLKSFGNSMKEQLEKKKERMIQQEKYALRKTPGRLSKSPNVCYPKSKPRKISPKKGTKATPRKIGKKSLKNNDTSAQADDVKQNSSRSNKTGARKKSVEATDAQKNDNHDSQDEFFKKSGSNLHRKNKGLDKSSDSISDAKPDLEDQESNTSNESNISTSKTTCQNNVLKDLKDVAEDNVPEKIYAEETQVEMNESFDTCHFYAESAVYIHDDQKPSEKKMDDYDLSNLTKRNVCQLPCAGGTDESVVTSVSPFVTLLDLQSSLNHSIVEDDIDGANKTCEHLSDSENLDDKTEEAEDVRKIRKRKRRSDSCGSNSSGKKSKVHLLLNSNNIENLLTKIHGPN